MTRRTLLAAAALAGAAGLAWVALRAQPGPLRVAILPFEDPTMDAATAALVIRLGERVLAGLTPRLGDHADVLGPRTTGPLLRDGRPIREIAAELDAAYVINARFIGTREAPEILVELIRTDDGRHVWVRHYLPGQWDAAADEVVAGIAALLLATPS